MTLSKRILLPTMLALLVFCSMTKVSIAASAAAKPTTAAKTDKSKKTRNSVPSPSASPTTSERLGVLNDDGSVTCPTRPDPVPTQSRSEVYASTPYKAGELADYEVSYMGALVGTAKMEVRPPVKQALVGDPKPVWLRSFHIDAATGDWYKLIFVAHDRVDAYIRPWDHGINRFYIEQDEGKMFGQRFQQKKWLEFNHFDCKVEERTQRIGKPEKREKFPIMLGSMDTLGIAYWMREQNFTVVRKFEHCLLIRKKLVVRSRSSSRRINKNQGGDFSGCKIKVTNFYWKRFAAKR